MLQHESSESEYLLCTLQHGHLLQQPLDLVFATGEQISFSLNGSGVVHLTGYLMSDMDDTMGEEFSESDDDEDVPELISAQEIKGKRKAEPELKKSKKIKLLQESGDHAEESDEDDDDDSEDDEKVKENQASTGVR